MVLSLVLLGSVWSYFGITAGLGAGAGLRGLALLSLILDLGQPRLFSRMLSLGARAFRTHRISKGGSRRGVYQMAETFMKSIAAFLIVFVLSSAPAFAQQCGKGQMPSPNGCIQVCPPGSTIGKSMGFDTCLRDGNAQIGAHHRKYASLPIAAGKDVDGICFGIREDESVETVVDDRFVDADRHVQKGHAYVAAI